MSWFWRIRLMLLGVVAFFLLCFGAYWGVVSLIHANAAAPFKPHLAEYLAPAAGPVAPGPVKGKMVVLDKATGQIDHDVFFELPSDLRAVKPEEVGTVVLVEWVKKLEPNYTYGPGTSASRQDCNVTVIDHARRAVIGQTTVPGGPPPSSIDEHATEGVGPKSTAQVVQYLKSLPRG